MTSEDRDEPQGAERAPDYDLEALCRGLGVTCLKLDRDAETPDALERVAAVTGEDRPVVVDVAAGARGTAS